MCKSINNSSSVMNDVKLDSNSQCSKAEMDYYSLMFKRIEEERIMREIISRIQAKLDRGELIGVSESDNRETILYTDAELEARIMD